MRISCCVPHCRRTIETESIQPVFDEWLCANHWRLVRPIRRKTYLRAKREALKYGIVIPQRLNVMWEIIKAEAMREAGL